jgi:hypothetical protein
MEAAGEVGKAAAGRLVSRAYGMTTGFGAGDGRNVSAAWRTWLKSGQAQADGMSLYYVATVV